MTTTVPSRNRPRRRRPDAANTLPIDSYARRSVGFDDEHAMNEELQHKSNRRGIENANRTLGLELSDGISAWDDEKFREDWNVAMQRMEDGRSGGVSVWQGDRWTRQMIELEQMFKRVRGLGCVLITMGITYELDNPMHQQMLRMLTIQSQASSDNTSFKVLEKLAEQREQGIHNFAGPRVFGHPGLLPGKGRVREEAPADQVERERKAVAKAFADLLLGTANLTSIAEEWNAAGFTGTRGGRWTNSIVRQNLRLPIHAGLLVHYGEIVGTAKNVDPIVTPEDFYAAHAMFSGRGHGTKARTLASNYVYCSRCDRGMVAKPIGTPPRPGYLCARDRGQGGGRGCGATVFAEYVDTFLAELVAERLSSSAVTAGMSAAMARVGEESATLAAQLGKDRETMARLGRDLAAGVLDYDLMAAAAGPINKRIREAETRIAELSSLPDVEIEAEDRAAITAKWGAATVDERRDMVRDATRGIRVMIHPGRNFAYAPERMVEWMNDRVSVIPLESPLS